RIMGRYLTGAIAVLLFFFRSGTAFYRFVMESYKEGELIGELIENTEFIGYTPNENWGLWCFNVYLNQRHLGFGLLIVTMALWIFMDWLEDGDAHTEKGAGWMADRLYAPESWKSKDLPAAAVVGVLLGLTSFWNGAAVIGGLLILAGFALFSDGKVDYAVMAGITIILSVLQSRFFMTGSAVDFSLYWGFIAEDRSIMGVLWFVIQLSGIYYFAMLVISVYLKRIQRSAMTAFFLPFVFAFTVSLTPDITVNHKYIMMSYAFLAMFWAFAFVEIWRLGKGMQIVSVLAAVALLATGIYDFVIIIRDNDVFHRVIFEEDNELTGWISENLSSQELVLTPEYSINEVTLSGVMMYCGWPYYAWSAGYDTDMRAKLAEEIYTSSDEARVSQLVEQEGITYILYETGMEYEGQICQEDTIRALYEPVFETSDQYYRIYKVD
ncbi:MAG: hypothetical protein KBT01_04735, partial [Clostridiales bacterium]|nr:hypothetical protein [Candidatus Blautia equi]